MINENDEARNAIKEMFGVGDKPIPEKKTKSVPAEVTESSNASPAPPAEGGKEAVHETQATKRLSLDMLGEVLQKQVGQGQVAVPSKSTTPECRKAVAEQLKGKNGTDRLQGLLERLM